MHVRDIRTSDWLAERSPRVGRALLFSCGLLVLGAVNANGTTVDLSLLPVETLALPGDTVVLELQASGLGDFAPDSIGDFDLDINFDPDKLTLTGFELGPFLGDIALNQAVDFSLGEVVPGTLNLAEVSLLEPDSDTCIFCVPPFLDDIQPGSFTLATLDFEVGPLGPRQSTFVTIGTINALGDGFGLPLEVGQLSGAEIMNPIPEPQAMALFAIGALLVQMVARRRDARAG